jgi:hypothetical protein
MPYFVIGNDGDGGGYAEQLSTEELEKRINPDSEGSIDYEHFLSKINDPDTNTWDGAVLIIKGEIVVPKAVTKVVKMALDDDD